MAFERSELMLVFVLATVTSLLPEAQPKLHSIWGNFLKVLQKGKGPW